MAGELDPGERGREREHDGGVGYEPPLDTLSSAIDGVEQGGHTIEEQHDDDSWDRVDR